MSSLIQTLETPDPFELEVVWTRRLVLAAIASCAVGILAGFETTLRLVTVIGLFIVVLGIFRPTFAMLGIGLLCCLDTVSRPLIMTGGIFRWNTLNYLLLVLIIIYSPTLLRLRSIQVRLLQLLILVLIIGLSISPSIELGSQSVISMVGPLGVIALAVCAHRQNPDTWRWLAIINGIVGAFGGFLFLIQRDQLPPVNYNAFAYFPLCAIFSICLAWKIAPRWERLALFLLACTNFCWIIASTSRGSLLVGLCCLLYLVATTPGLSRVIVVTSSCVFCILILSLFPEMQTKSQERLVKLLDQDRSLQDRTSGRYNLAAAGWRIFKSQPLGVGTGGFPSAWTSLDDRDGIGDWKSGNQVAAHSGWIRVLAENGVPGIAALVLFVVSFALPSQDRNYWALGALISATLAVAFISTEFQAKGLWLLAAGGIAICHARSESAQAVRFEA